MYSQPFCLIEGAGKKRQSKKLTFITTHRRLSTLLTLEYAVCVSQITV